MGGGPLTNPLRASNQNPPTTAPPAPRGASGGGGVWARASGSIGHEPSRSTDTASRSPSTSSNDDGSSYFGRSDTMSAGSGPARTFSYSAVSATVRASGPQWQ